jgi:hypothetical protein
MVLHCLFCACIIDEIVNLPGKVEMGAGGILLEEGCCHYGLQSGRRSAKGARLMSRHMNRLILITIIIRWQNSHSKRLWKKMYHHTSCN